MSKAIKAASSTVQRKHLVAALCASVRGTALQEQTKGEQSSVRSEMLQFAKACAYDLEVFEKKYASFCDDVRHNRRDIATKNGLTEMDSDGALYVIPPMFRNPVSKIRGALSHGISLEQPNGEFETAMVIQEQINTAKESTPGDLTEIQLAKREMRGYISALQSLVKKYTKKDLVSIESLNSSLGTAIAGAGKPKSETPSVKGLIEENAHKDDAPATVIADDQAKPKAKSKARARKAVDKRHPAEQQADHQKAA
jgi:hypothetical protein